MSISCPFLFRCLPISLSLAIFSYFPRRLSVVCQSFDPMCPSLSLPCFLPVSFPNLSVFGASFVPFLAGISHNVLFVSCPCFLFLSVSYISLAFLPIICLFSVSVSHLSPVRLLPIFCPLLSASYPPLACLHLANCLPVPS